MINQQFYKDLEAARDAELLVKDLLAGATQDYDFYWIGDNPTYYHKGDIAAVNKITNEVRYIEVKDDSRIADTGNILCEEEVEFYDGDYSRKGNIYNEFDAYVVVSKQAKRIYVLGAEALKANYTRGYKRYIGHKTQGSNVYLLPLSILKDEGGLLATIEYDLESRRASLYIGG
jgi:hypothetical protein